MKLFVVFLLLAGTSAWSQDGNCQRHSTPGPRTATCSCTGSQVTNFVCQSDLETSQGCNPVGGTFFCNSSCGFLTGTGCIPGGPRSKPLSFSSPLERELKSAFNTEPALGIQTCGDDGVNFEKWLMQTKPRRQAQATKGI